jgi:hypothetical protein
VDEDVFFRINERPPQIEQVKTSQLRRLVFEKRLPRYKLGRAVYLKLSDVIALLESGRMQ